MISRIFFNGLVTDSSSQKLIKEILDTPLDIDIELWINSPGGDLLSALGVTDVIQARNNINTVICGRAYSSAVLIALSGQQRFITPKSMIMLHDVEFDYGNDLTKYTSAIQEHKYHKALQLRVKSYLLSRTKMKPFAAAHLITKNSYLDAKNAIKYNICTGLMEL